MDQDFGLIFDWDGVVIDSHAAHEESWELLAQRRQKNLPEGFFKKTFGMRNAQIFPAYFGEWLSESEEVRNRQIQELGDEKEALYRDVLRRTGVTLIPGVVDFLRKAKEANLPCVVGSSTPIENILFVMELTGLKEYFQSIVAAADVQRGKPAPDVFLKGAERIGKTPSECVVFEDAHVGLAAAKAARIAVIALATTHPPESLREANWVVSGWDEVSFEQIREVILEHRLAARTISTDANMASEG